MEQKIPSLSPGDYRLALLVWDHGPLSSGRLAALAGEQLHWSRSTAYTVLHRLTEKGILENKNALVRPLIFKEAVQQARLEGFIDQVFSGSSSELLELVRRKYGPCFFPGEQI